MRKIFIACVAASMAALFACQSSKTVKATLADLKGEWNIVVLMAKMLPCLKIRMLRL